MRSILFVLLLASFSCERTANPENQDNRELNAIISQFENDLSNDLIRDNIDASLSAAVVHDDRIIWAKAFGYADKTNKIPADTTTIYRAGSISKSFTAFLMMQLVEEGVINLNDPVELYLPEIKNVLGYSDSTKLTFYQLASHTSALAREPQLENAAVGGIEGWENKLIASLPTAYFVGIPGTKFNYSNIGFGILGLALSRAANKPFMELVEERIFIPLRMSQSFYVVPDVLKTKLAVGMEGGPSEELDMDPPRQEHNGRGYKVPSGGIYSTPSDLAKFMVCNLRHTALLKKENLEMMQSGKSPEYKYGLGFMVFKHDDLNIVGHNGQVSGYTAQFAFEKNSRFGVILMRNYTHGATDLDKVSFELLSKLRRLKSQ